MRIFIVGGTGVLGKRVVSKLIENNHNLLVLTRSKEKSEFIRELGAEPVEGSLFNQDDMNSFCNNRDGIINMATSIPNKLKTKPKDWKETLDIREIGKKILIQASLNNNCKFFVQESFLLVYGNRNGQWVNEETPITTPVPLAYRISEGYQNILNNAVLAEEILHDAYKTDKLPYIILRYGIFYCADSLSTIDMLKMMKKHRFPIIGKGTTFTNPIHVDDAASVTVLAAENYSNLIGKTFNICDNEPVPIGEFFRYVAFALGVKPPMRLPKFIAKFALDPYMLNVIFSSLRCKNSYAKDQLGWKLKYPTYKEGIRSVIEETQIS